MTDRMPPDTPRSRQERPLYPPWAAPRPRSPITPIRLGILGGVLLAVIAGGIWFSRGSAPPAAELADLPTGTPMLPVEHDITPRSTIGIPELAVVETPEPSDIVESTVIPAQPPEECEPFCLARMPSDESTDTFLAEFGAQPTYRHGNTSWVSVDNKMLTRLRTERRPFELVEDINEYTHLYVIRLPDGLDRSAIGDIGTIIDGEGNQFLVDIPGSAPYMLDLADRGISVEKLPPLLPPLRNRDGKPEIGNLGALLETISTGQLEQRVSDLQSMGAKPGELGSREYSQPGNVQAAEYLYRRLASYGLNVWYEDFIADNGRLMLNVVGEIPGKDDSQIYLLGAHFDSIAADTENPTVAPGALDNASGVAVLLETARVLSGYTLEHPVHFAFFNAEEYGLQGAHAFARDVSRTGVRSYAGAFNVDFVAAAFDQNQLYLNSNESSEYLANLLVDVNDRWGLGINMMPKMSSTIQADDTELNNYGIPAIMVGAVLYGDPWINRAGDTIDFVDIWYLRAVTELMTIATAELVGPGGG